jgi:hypothetical protein
MHLRSDAQSATAACSACSPSTCPPASPACRTQAEAKPGPLQRSEVPGAEARAAQEGLDRLRGGVQLARPRPRHHPDRALLPGQRAVERVTALLAGEAGLPLGGHAAMPPAHDRGRMTRRVQGAPLWNRSFQRLRILHRRRAFVRRNRRPHPSELLPRTTKRKFERLMGLEGGILLWGQRLRRPWLARNVDIIVLDKPADG